jgi:hypothetical protein
MPRKAIGYVVCVGDLPNVRRSGFLFGGRLVDDLSQDALHGGWVVLVLVGVAGVTHG